MWIEGRQPGINCWGQNDTLYHLWLHHTVASWLRNCLLSRPLQSTPLKVFAKTLDVPEVFILTREPLSFIITRFHHVLFPPNYTEQIQSLLLHQQKGGGGICFSHAVIRMMLISFILMFSSNLDCNQCFISSAAAIKRGITVLFLPAQWEDPPWFGISLFPISPPNCIWIFISFKLDVNDTNRNTPRHLEKVKLISCLNEIVWEFCFILWIPQKDHVALDLENIAPRII